MSSYIFTEEEKMDINKYKREKIKLLNELGFLVDSCVFNRAKNEIQVDNIAHSIILGSKII